MPIVSKDIKNYLDIEPSKAVDPDFAVAEGAAIQAGIIQGSIKQEESILMTDVNPYTLGIRIMDGVTEERMSVIIPRNVTIPTTRSQVYYTCMDYQTEAHIEIYQGESEIVSSNHFLGEFIIGQIPAKKSGVERIAVEFSYNMNGMLAVKATILSTGKDASVEIDMMQEVQDPKGRIDVSNWKESPYAKQFRTIIRRVERVIKDPVADDPFLWQELDDALYDLKEALVNEDLETAQEAEEDLLELLEEL